MDATDIADFLGDQRTGVLSLADDDDAYAVPVSFFYEPDEQRVYFRLGFAPGSQKQKFVKTTEHASFVVHSMTDQGWASVVASGRLETLADSTLDTSIVEALRGLDIPYFSVFERPADDIEFTIVRLNVDNLSGLVEGH